MLMIRCSIINAANEKLRKVIEAAQKAADKAIEAAKKKADKGRTETNEEADQELKKSRDSKNQKLFAMQKDFSHLPLLRQVYHEAPDDVFELILSECCDLCDDKWGRGGLNVFRLANKRLKQVVESCTTKLTNQHKEDGPESLPIPVIQRCRRINAIRCVSHNLRSLEGCPDGLQSLWIGDAPHLSDLFPLASCSKMESLVLTDSSVTDISVVSSMLLLNVFACYKGDPERPLIKDLSPLSSCPQLKVLFLTNNRDLEDLSPLSAFSDLEILDISFSPLITSLTSLSSLMGLKHLGCYAVDPETSLLPLSSCTGLERLDCNPDAIDLEELRRRRPEIEIHTGH